MVAPLLALAATVMPEILRTVAGDRAGTAAGHVVEAVRAVTGTDDPAEAKRRLESTPEAAIDLRLRLAEIALEQERLRHQSEMEELRLRSADIVDARRTMVESAPAGGPAAWGAPLVSAMVGIGFFGTLIMVVATDYSPAENQFLGSLLNIIVGALVAAFTAVVNFWIGSSESSRSKDAVVRVLQTAQAQQTDAAIRGLRDAAKLAQPPATPRPPTTPPAAATPGRTGDRFERCLALVLEHEGGFANHPDDPGGATKYGITHRTLSDFRGAEVTVEDVRALTREEAREIYRANYWNPMRCGELPAGVDLMVFDFGVNAGPGRSVRLLQQAAGVTADGSIGPITMAAVGAADPKRLIAPMAERRMDYYRSLSTFDTFGRGWTRRTDATREAALQMALEAAAQSGTQVVAGTATALAA